MPRKKASGAKLFLGRTFLPNYLRANRVPENVPTSHIEDMRNSLKYKTRWRDLGKTS